jgi:hypothetical protein
MTKEERKIYNKAYREKNKEKLINYKNNNKHVSQEYYILNKEKRIKYAKEYYEENKDKINIRNREYSKKHYNKNADKYKQYNLEKYNSNIQTKLSLSLRCRLNNSLKHGLKIESALILLGCSIDNLKKHIEQQFKSEMTWENHGEIWEIDHIMPCALFDLTNIEQQKQCFHYTNLQPLFKTTDIAINFGYISEVGNRNKSKNVAL